jgi:hypothetical protein
MRRHLLAISAIALALSTASPASAQGLLDALFGTQTQQQLQGTVNSLATREARDQADVAAAELLSEITRTSVGYVIKNQDALQTATAGGQFVVVTVAQLQAAGFLDPAWTGQNTFGQGHLLVVTQPRANGHLEGYVITTGSPLTNGKARMGNGQAGELVKTASLVAGGAGGFVPLTGGSGTLTVAAGGWALDTTMTAQLVAAAQSARQTFTAGNLVGNCDLLGGFTLTNHAGKTGQDQWGTGLQVGGLQNVGSVNATSITTPSLSANTATFGNLDFQTWNGQSAASLTQTGTGGTTGGSTGGTAGGGGGDASGDGAGNGGHGGSGGMGGSDSGW